MSSEALQSHVRHCLRYLVEGKDIEATDFMQCVSEIVHGKASQALTGAFLTALRFYRITPPMLYHGAKVLSDLAVDFKYEGDAIDIVGIGGDSVSTFNVSIATAMIVAAVDPSSLETGPKHLPLLVAKYGNRSSSPSKCGSADLIEAIGARLELSSEDFSKIIKQCHFAFLYAQYFHPSIKSVLNVRRELGISTVFNTLRPLTSPARPNYMLIGVAKKEIGELYAQTFVLAKKKRIMIVCPEDGVEEISPCASTHAWIVEGDCIKRSVITPEAFGMKRHQEGMPQGSGTAEENAKILNALFSGKETGILLDFLLINAAAALFVAGYVNDFKHGVSLARETIESGRAYKLLHEYIRLTQQASMY